MAFAPESTAERAYSEPRSAAADRQWYIVGRWQEYDGELRANLIRTISIGAFYSVELLGYYGVDLAWLHIEPEFTRQFHLAVSAGGGLDVCRLRHDFTVCEWAYFRRR